VSSSAALVLFGDVAASRLAPTRSSRWLRTLTAELDRQYGAVRLARFGFTQGDELQGVLDTTADPFRSIVMAALHPDGLPMRWAVSVGPVDPGSGPATQRTGPAFLAAREAITRAKSQRDRLVVVTGDPVTDTLLADVAPLLMILLGELTERQREIARLMLVDGMRQADVSDRLRIARPTVSVAVERARVREIGRLGHALATLLRLGIRSAAGDRASAS
jgi:DNA-binding CsgD family transcriptional regulator